MTLKTDIDRIATDAGLLHSIIHGTAGQTVTTEGGNVPTVAKSIADMVTYWQGLGVTLSQNPAAVAISGGAINGAVIGNLNPAAATFTTVTANSGVSGVNTLTASGGDQLDFAPGTGASKRANMILRATDAGSVARNWYVGSNWSQTGGNFEIGNGVTRFLSIAHSTGNVSFGAGTAFPNTLSQSLDMPGGLGLFGYNNGAHWTTNAHYEEGWKYKATNIASRVALGTDGSFEFDAAVSGTAGTAVTWVPKFLVDAAGDLIVGTTSGDHRLILDRADGRLLAAAKGGVTAFYLEAGGTPVTGYSASNTICFIAKDSVTLRSQNCAGTINASGADYAEYMRKVFGCGAISKGAIVGIDADGLITDLWSRAISFAIKSTDPSYVGGDVWGSEDQVGRRPDEPRFAAPEYTGRSRPEVEAPIEPVLALPPGPEQQIGETDDTFYARRLLWQRLAAEREAEHAQAMAAYQAALAAWQELMAGYEADHAAHVAAVAAAQAHFDSVTMPGYRAELAAFEARLEAARQTVDRIAFAGQVPVNVLGAAPGDYIVPEADGDGIKGVALADPSFEQYRRAVGKVIAVEVDGRARIIVKVA